MVVTALVPSEPPVLRFERPYRGSSPGCCWSLQQLRVVSIAEVGGETELGIVQQRFCSCCCSDEGCCGPLLGVHDAQGRELFTIVGPCLYCDSPCCDAIFEIRHANEAVGEFRRHGETLTPAQDPAGATSVFTNDAPVFGLTMPNGAPILHRALLLGALVLLVSHGNPCWSG